MRKPFKPMLISAANYKHLWSPVNPIMPDVCEICDFLINIPEKLSFSVSCGANH